MKAAVLVEQDQPLKILELEMPKTLGVGQVMVKLIKSGICGTQLNEISGRKGLDPFLPHLLGHEAVAQIQEVGPGVKKVKPNDFVILHWKLSSGIQSDTPIYNSEIGPINAGWVTTFNDFSIVSENRLTKLQPGVSLNENYLPMLGCALTTALGAVEKQADVKENDDVLIMGAGGIGISIILFCLLKRARTITIIDIDETKQSVVMAIGATRFIKYLNKDQTRDEIVDFYKSNKPTVVFETTGVIDCIELSYELSDTMARIILIGVPNSNSNASLHTLKLHFGKKLLGSHGGNSEPEKEIPRIISMHERNLINLNSIPNKILKFEDVNQGIQLMREGQPGRVLLDFS